MTGGTGGKGGGTGGAGSGGKGGTGGVVGSGGSAGSGVAGGAGSSPSGTGGVAGAGAAGATGATGGAAGSMAGATGAGAGTGGGTAGGGGASGSGGATSGSAGAGGMSGGPGGGGAGGMACGDAGEACCAGNSCGNNLLCLNGATCSCAQALVGRYILRTDGALLYESDPTATAQTPVLDGTTGLPLAGVTGVQEGAYHGCAVLGSSKTAWCWRTGADGNASGQLGNGTTDALTTSFQATEVLTAANTPLTNVVGIASLEVPAVFSNRSKPGGGCAVTGDGRIYCWGDVTYLVNGGTALTSSYAIPITTDGTTPFTGALQVSINANAAYACAIVQGASSKEVWCWGRNQNGYLGLGDQTSRTYPTKVLGISNPIKLLASGPANTGADTSTTCALDGANVRCWGDNANGETGTGTTTTAPLLSPALVTLMGGTTAFGNVVDLHGGDSSFFSNFCALTTANSLYCWGYFFQAYPADIATNVAEVGGTGNYIRYLTADGLYHFGTANDHAGTTRVPNCGPLH